MRHALPLIAATLFGCADGATDTDPVDSGGVPLRACETSTGRLPDGLTELAWHEGEGVASVDGLVLNLDTGPMAFADNLRFEAVRFDHEHPIRVHGFTVQLADADALSPEAAVEAHLYADFGYNGFDFWTPDPLATATRCAGDAEDGALTFSLPEPVEIEHPGLVYVGHRVEPGDGTGWAITEPLSEPSRDCGPFEACHSALNFPEVMADSQFNGLSLPLGRDFAVSLHVEEVVDPAAAEPRFTQLDLDLSNRGAFGDFDHDGWDDLFVRGGTLLRNVEGRFVDVTAESGIASAGSGGVWGDYDNDGCLDLFVFTESTRATDRLYRGDCRGSFEDVTEGVGLVDPRVDTPCTASQPDSVLSPSAGAAWFDADLDGDLDLYVSHFVCWDRWVAYPDAFFRNDGGTFVEATADAGFPTSPAASRGATPIDADQDGDVDLHVNRYWLQANHLYEADGIGGFAKAAPTSRIEGVWNGGSYGHTIGVAFGDLDRDGDFDLVEANLAHPRFFHFSDKTRVLLRGDDGVYLDQSGDWTTPTSAAGLRFQETHSSPVLADFDVDGVLDLLITATYAGRPTDLYYGLGDGTFRLDSYTSGLTLTGGWGAAASDWDRDGDPDLFASGLWRNDGPTAGRALSVRVLGDGVRTNRMALGATVRARVGSTTVVRFVPGGTGQGNQDSMYLQVPVPDGEAVRWIEVDFPGGDTQRYEGPFEPDQRVWLQQAETAAYVGWEPPAP